MNIERKPRIWYEYDAWWCSVNRMYNGESNRIVGVGDSPIAAFNAWRKGSIS